MIPVAGDRARAGRTRFLLHDQAALDAGLEPRQLAGFDSLGDAHQLADRDVECLLGPLSAGAGITQHGAAIAQGVRRGVHAVAQPSLLTHFGEQARTHAAAEHADRAPGLEIVGVIVRRAFVGDADLRLIRLVGEVRLVRQRRAGRWLCNLARSPVVEQFSHVILQALPVHVAGHAQNRAIRMIVLGKVVLNVCQLERLYRIDRAIARTAPGIGIVVAPQLEHHLLPRLILDAAQLLQHHESRRFELRCGKVGPPQHVGKDLQRRINVLRKRRARVAGVTVRNRFASFDAQILQVAHELAAIARTAAAQSQLASERAQASQRCGFVRAARRNQKRKCRRLQRTDRLGHQHQAVGIHV